MPKNRDDAILATEPVGLSTGQANTNLPYTDFGIIPDVAQRAQAMVPENPHLNPQHTFSDHDHAVANWFTTRVHLSPLGKIHTRKDKDKSKPPKPNRGITTNV